MIQTRMLFWTALVLGSSLPALTHAQPAHRPSASSDPIQLYSRPLEEETAAPALPDAAEPPPTRRYGDLPPEQSAPAPDRQPIPKLRFEDLPPESASPLADPVPAPALRPLPKTRYDDAPPPVTRTLPLDPDPDPDEETVDTDPPLPGERLPIQDYRGIRYVSGGVGEGERAEINALSDRFNLRLLFAMQGSGSYVADVQVSVRDSRGESVLVATSNGPWFLAELPPGTYTVVAEVLDQVRRQTARIGGPRQTRLNFYWR